MRLARVLSMISACLLTLVAAGQEANTAKVVFAGDVSSFTGMSQFGSGKDKADVVFGTATGDFRTIRHDEENGTAYALSLSSKDLPGTRHAGLVQDLTKGKLHWAGLKKYGDFTTFTGGGVKFGFASFGSTPMSLARKDSVVIKTIVSRLKYKTNIVAVAYSYDSKGAMEKSVDGYVEDVRYFAHLCIDAGADVVFVSGHKTQLPLELYGDRLIIYGQEGCPIGVELGDDGEFLGGVFLKSGNRIAEMTNEYFPDTPLLLHQNKIMKTGSTQTQGMVHNLLAEASKYRGRSYKWGATGPRQFDCSGFTGYVFKLMGYSLPRTSQEQSKVGMRVERNDLRPGDLVFFTRPATRGAGHVGIVYSVNEETGDFNFIHASTSKGVVIDNFSSLGYFVKRYMGARRIIMDKPIEFPSITNEIEGIDTKDINKRL